MYARDEALIATPIGTVRVFGDENTLESIRIDLSETRVSRGTAAAVQLAAEQIEAWFAGARRDFALPLMPAQTPRGAAIRQGLVDIPFGETISYGHLAIRLASAPRAIGQACARNPFPIVVPCHRVTAAGGVLGNYSGGDGSKTKRWLIDHERKLSGKILL